jgi:hypothetical protein
MKRVSVILVATASTLFLSAASRRTDSAPDPRESHLRAEVARLRAHFDSVDTELRTSDVSHLSAQKRASRTKLIGWLREYRDAGRFPINDRFANLTIPFFRDSQGTLCAMAYLVDRTGRGDIVDRIARTRNNAYIPELTDDRDLVGWLDASGLSVSEAARIQPAYNFPPPIVVSDPKRVSSNYALLSMGLGGSSLGTLGFNLFSPSRTSGAAGLTLGVAAILAGAAHIKDGGGDETVAKADVAVGSAAVIGAVRALFTTRASGKRVQAETSRRQAVSNAVIAPDVIYSPSGTRLGFSVTARF